MSGKRWEGSAELKADIRDMIEERLENSLDIAVSTGNPRPRRRRGTAARQAYNIYNTSLFLDTSRPRTPTSWRFGTSGSSGLKARNRAFARDWQGIRVTCPI